jgi:hypothetical protein
VIKGYFDNSGDAEDPQHKVLTVGGFLANDDQWARFEDIWKANLETFGLPYLHMKEFAHFVGPFVVFKDNEEDRIRFIEGCVSSIRDAGIDKSVCHCIRLNDTRRFNADYNRKIDPFSFCLYISYVDIQDKCKDDKHIELVVDHFSKVTKKIYLAEEYARTDSFHKNLGFNIATRPLSEALSFRDVPPMQAADFLVWELRKSETKYDEWFEIRKPGGSDGEWVPELWEWTFHKWGKVFNERKSLMALHAACNSDGIVITYKTLVTAQQFHPNGWGEF